MTPKYYDLSPLISNKISVFPGDTPFKLTTNLSFENKDNLKLSDFKSTLHLGSHADAPNHYHREGCDIASRSLDYYIGDAQVIDVSDCFQLEGSDEKTITPSMIEKKEIQATRVLFKTKTFEDPDTWKNDFAHFHPETIEYLSGKKVITVGIDTPSIDAATSKDLLSHGKIYQFDMAILEGLVLSDVPEGVYQLVALPLKIKEADASPVRCILIRQDS